MTRRISLIPFVVAVAVVIAGCSDMGDFSDTDMGQLGELLFHQITKIGTSESVPRARAAAIPYASLGVRLGSSDESMFVLGSKTGNDLHWLGGQRLAITTRGGRIVQTAGFEHNLTGFQGGAEATSPGTKNFVYDFAERARYGIAVRCATRPIGRERLLVLGVPHDTNHVAEDCQAPQLDWEFRNEFWSDGSGLVWKSKQSVEPDLDGFELEILRPAD
jgi:hypothetical protein